MSAPDRIWHAIDRKGKISGCPDAHVMPCADVQEAYTEYVRAALRAPQDARVQALEAENARLRDALSLYSCDDGCNDCPEHERDRVGCGWTALAALRDREQGEP